MKIALTQSEGRLETLEKELLERGYKVIRNPLIETQAILTNDAKARAEALRDSSWLLFTSPAGVEAWRELGLTLSCGKGLQPLVGCVGSKTAHVIEDLGGQVDLIAEPQNALGLANTFLASSKAASPVGLPRGDRALLILQDELEKNGFETRPATIYQTITKTWQAGEVDVAVLSSPSAVEALPTHIGKRAKLIALGPSTGNAIAEFGWDYAQAKNPDIVSILSVLERWIAV